MTRVTLKRVRDFCCLSAICMVAFGSAHAAVTPTATLKNPIPPRAQAPAVTGVYKGFQPVNVLVNGNGDADIGSDSSVRFVCPSHWACNREFTIVQYGVESFPSSRDPGPSDRGANMFAGGGGGQGNVSTATQTINLASFGGRISSGQQTFTLSGYLGGWGNQDDHADVWVVFMDANGAQIGSPTNLQSVTPGERHDVNALLARTATGTVPAGATSAVVTVQMTELDGGYNDGYADSLSLILN